MPDARHFKEQLNYCIKCNTFGVGDINFSPSTGKTFYLSTPQGRIGLLLTLVGLAIIQVGSGAGFRLSSVTSRLTMTSVTRC